jgi:hypothetical protein
LTIIINGKTTPHVTVGSASMDGNAAKRRAQSSEQTSGVQRYYGAGQKKMNQRTMLDGTMTVADVLRRTKAKAAPGAAMDRMRAVGKVTEIEAAPHLRVCGMSGDVLNPTMRTIRKRMKGVRGAAVPGPVKEVVAPRKHFRQSGPRYTSRE